MDLDDFKSVNDRYGHNIGDRFLKAVSSRLQECVTDGIEFLGRLSGDEFLMSGFVSDTNTDSGHYYDMIKKQFENEFALDRVSVKSGISVGYALYSEFHDIDSMVHHADEQMYKIKQNRKSSVRR